MAEILSVGNDGQAPSTSPVGETAAPLAGDALSATLPCDDGASDDDSSVEPHPLQFTWTLWHDQPSKTRSWGSELKVIASFGTVEEFWA
jgi:Eukaryotic initiation factor 4E